MSIISISGKINSGKDTVGKIIQILTASPHFTNEAVVDFLKRDLYGSDWKIKKFADKLKDIACILLGCTREELEDREFKEKELGEEWDREVYYNGEVNHGLSPISIGLFSKRKEKMTPRLLLQLLGTECGRQIIHPNIWVNALMSEYKLIKDTKVSEFLKAEGLPETMNGGKEYYPNWIITDMRFPNELKAVEDRGGISIRVNRDYVLTGGPEDPKDQHESETALDDAKFDYEINNDDSLVELVEKVREILLKEKVL